MLEITMFDTLSFSVKKLDKEVVSKIKKVFRVPNPAYDSEVAESEEPKYLQIFEIKDGVMHIPRGAMNALSEILEEHSIECELIDKRVLHNVKPFPKLLFDLRKYQKKIIKKGYPMTQGTVVSPCGSGKTISAVAMIVKCQQRTLVIVPDNEILSQWVERIHQSTGMDLNRIGVITSKVVKYEGVTIEHRIKDITISTNASAYQHVGNKKFVELFGLVILDEAHLVGARTFREVMNSFPAMYRYGWTATDFRNDGLTNFIGMFCGIRFIEVTDSDLIKAGQLIKPHLEVIETDYKYTYNFKYKAAYAYMMKDMCRDRDRNDLIASIVRREFKAKRMVLIVAKLVDHCKILYKILQKRCHGIRIGFMAGEDYDDETVTAAREGNIDVILSVNRAKIGLDIKPLETVFLVAPRSALNEVIQIVGRVSRPDDCFGRYKSPGEKYAKVIDLYDRGAKTITGGCVMKKSFLSRMEAYEDKCYLDGFDCDEFIKGKGVRKNGTARHAKSGKNNKRHKQVRRHVRTLRN